ncbi:MAG: divalent-cation tolerance protein CutA, partial [Synechococcaceae bacterium WB8_1B_136]|nr:divalent-cation tolerance protein CutA [Synechococcaceae bacterium WB8_1B_136]
HALLERRLAACVALSPLEAHYHWQGRIEQSSEVQLLIKTHPDRLDALEQAVHELHSYDTPEWIHWRAEAAPHYGLSPGGRPPAPGGSPGDGGPAGSPPGRHRGSQAGRRPPNSGPGCRRAGSRRHRDPRRRWCPPRGRAEPARWRAGRCH